MSHWKWGSISVQVLYHFYFTGFWFYFSRLEMWREGLGLWFEEYCTVICFCDCSLKINWDGFFSFCSSWWEIFEGFVILSLFDYSEIEKNALRCCHHHHHHHHHALISHGFCWKLIWTQYAENVIMMLLHKLLKHIFALKWLHYTKLLKLRLRA